MFPALTEEKRRKCMLKSFACFVFMFVFLQISVYADAKNWDELKRHKKGESISILMKSGRSFDAKIEKVEDTKLLVRNTSDHFEVITRDKILKIYRNGVPLGKSIWRGVLIGAASGFVIGIATESQFSGEDRGLLTIMLTAAGAPVGAGLGALQSLSSKKLIYESDKEEPVQAALKTDSAYCAFTSLRSGAGAD
jgi:hypothetical protein